MVQSSNAVQSQVPSDEAPELIDIYYKFFEVHDAVTPEILRVAQQIRYQVYCVENAYEETVKNVSELETDEFDSHAGAAVLFHKPTGLPAGTVRMVLPLPDDIVSSFALQTYCKDPVVRDPSRFPVGRMGEISRFCVPKNFRRRIEDRNHPRLPNNSESVPGEQQRVIPNMTLGLIEWLVRFSVEQELTHWCAMMEPTLLRLLTRLGIHFDPIGNLVEFHGRRQPCFQKLSSLLERTYMERRDIWDVITDRGKHYEMLVSRQ